MARVLRTALLILLALVPISAGIIVTRESDETQRVERAPAPATAPAPSAAPTTTAPECTPDPSLAAPGAPTPAAVVAAVEQFAADPAVASGSFGVSIWIDGYGEIARNPDVALLPASNQKLLTAMGVLAVLGPDTRFTTEVRLTPDGTLVIVGGGDPTLTTEGTHSLDALAAQ